MTKIEILRQYKVNDSITAFAIESPFPRPEIAKYGIDPGSAKMGVAFVHPISNVTVMAYQIKMERGKTALDRVLGVQRVLSQLQLVIQPKGLVVIEGASYGSVYRQVELEDIRVAAMMWFHRYGIKSEIVPPTTVRKQVFGNGRIKNPWDNLPDDCVAALGCCFYDSNKISKISS
jgi:Holliday junction resolvasome RuvABC endonuclease subunit